ncbi:MAG: hypothetical protein NZO58_12300, partial [Gemmataceae bacterium]|nr:hypothetical protein [Gemmataceae bacterium]
LQLRPLTSIAELDRCAPEDTVIILFGNLRPFHEIRVRLAARQPPQRLDDFGVLVASNVATGGPQRPFLVFPEPDPALWGLRIVSDEVCQPAETAYQGRPSRPLLRPEHWSRNHPVFRGMQLGLATDTPGALIGRDADLLRLAVFPPDCFTATRRPKERDGEELDFIYGTAGDGQRRLLVVAGHGVFCNGLMVKPDTDNFLFAYNVLRWLQRGPGGKRTSVLMIRDGEVVANFDLPASSPRSLPQPSVQVINTLLRRLENEGIFHRFLEEQVGWHNVLKFALLTSAAGLLIWGSFRLVQARYTSEATPLVYGVVPVPLDRKLLDQRTLEWFAHNALWEPVQALARGWFLDHAGVAAPLWDMAAETSMPRAEYRTGWFRRRRLRAALAWLWSLATADPSRRVRRRDFERCLVCLQRLSDAVQAGELSFPAAATPVGH